MTPSPATGVWIGPAGADPSTCPGPEWVDVGGYTSDPPPQAPPAHGRLSYHTPPARTVVEVRGFYVPCPLCHAPILDPFPRDWSMSVRREGNTYGFTPHRPGCGLGDVAARVAELAETALLVAAREATAAALRRRPLDTGPARTTTADLVDHVVVRHGLVVDARAALHAWHNRERHHG